MEGSCRIGRRNRPAPATFSDPSARNPNHRRQSGPDLFRRRTAARIRIGPASSTRDQRRLSVTTAVLPPVGPGARGRSRSGAQTTSGNVAAPRSRDEDAGPRSRPAPVFAALRPAPGARRSSSGRDRARHRMASPVRRADDGGPIRSAWVSPPNNGGPIGAGLVRRLGATRPRGLRWSERFCLRWLRVHKYRLGMSARTVPYRTGLISVLKEIVFTSAQMEVEPLAAPYLPTFQAHRVKWESVFLQEVGIIEALIKTQAAAVRADRGLDRFVTKVLNAVEDYTDGTTKKLLLKKLLKGRSKAKFVRRVLSGQLLDMSDWANILAQSKVPELIALVPDATAVWDLGKAASDLRAAARNRNRDFRDLGARKQFIDEVNASRKEVDGALAKLPFQNPTLSQDFNDEFWMGDAPEEDETIADVEAAIKDLQAQLTTRQAQLTQMQQEAADEAKLAEQKKANDARAADLRAQAQKLLDEAATLDPQDK
jgi:hypothetical protein